MKGVSSSDLKKRPLLATDGVDMGEFEVSNIRFIAYDFAGLAIILLSNFKYMKDMGNIFSDLFNITGQEIYRYTHQIFLSDNAICLIVFDITESEDTLMDQIWFWLDSIIARCPGTVCILIATHSRKMDYDAASLRMRVIWKSAKKAFASRLVSCHLLDSLADDDVTMKKVTTSIAEIASKKVL